MIGKTTAILLGLVALCSTVSAVQPGCRTRYELRMKWAVQTDSSTYWECTRWGNAARKSCPVGTQFSAPFQTCVPNSAWEQFPYYAPPTTVTDYADECKDDLDVCVNPCENSCNGGQWVNGQCVCPPNFELIDGTCVYTPEIETCENGSWDATEMRCVCNEGYQLVDGKCERRPGSTGICDGASDEAHLVPGTMDCLPVECNDEQYWSNTLFPTRNPRTFFQCANQANVVEMPCAPGTCFDFRQQVCIHARDWVNQCN